ncbi:unnamed protein product [Schistocephalus solidus]|uniref:von Willebrand factor A domain-containing protein 5A n=1 Tax=Schistocephalus solidus TaxID=70667 RepID=A0A183STS2_SCHSO|nr:unnamed protein product [Schistocephalus solidus]
MDVREYPPTAIPLQTVRINTTIINATADVGCTFAFHNDSDKTLETEFCFPLDSDAAVYHFEAKIGEKRLIAKCRERVENVFSSVHHPETVYMPVLMLDLVNLLVAVDNIFPCSTISDGASKESMRPPSSPSSYNFLPALKAEATYKKAVEEDHTAFMMHEDEFMGDTFVMKVGNVPPKENIHLTLRYFTPLTVRDADLEEERFKDLRNSSLLVLTLPFVLNDRYGPMEGHAQRQFEVSTVPNLSNISADCKLDFTAEVFGSSPILAVTSPTQQTFMLKYATEDKLSASVKLESPFSFDSDLEMELAFADPHSMMISYEPAAKASESGTSDFLSSLDCITTNFLPNFPPSTEVASAGRRREIVFLIDRSGSMEGESIQQAKKALLIFLKSLPSACRFQIVGFGSIHAALFSEPLDYTEETLKRAIAYQEDLEADMGGTEVLPALEAVYAVPLTGAGWSRQIIFLTDGDVMNQTEVVSLVQKHSADSRLFAIGLGMGASTSLVKGVARAGGGKAVFVRNPESLATAVMDILKCTLQDPATEVSLSWQVQSLTSSSPLEVLTIPSHLPPLFYGSYLTVFGLVKNPAREKLTGSATLTFTLNGQSHCLQALLPQPSSAVSASSSSLLHRQAAKAQIIELVDQHSGLAGHRESGEAASEIQRKIVALAVAANVSSPFTSFIGVDPVSLGECQCIRLSNST